MGGASSPEAQRNAGRNVAALTDEGDVAAECLKAFRVGSEIHVAIANEVTDTNSLSRLRRRGDDGDADVGGEGPRQ